MLLVVPISEVEIRVANPAFQVTIDPRSRYDSFAGRPCESMGRAGGKTNTDESCSEDARNVPSFHVVLLSPRASLPVTKEMTGQNGILIVVSIFRDELYFKPSTFAEVC
ncbi:hypothetical protein M8312_04805 [Sphingomonas sp. KRR8]|uniref:hypothetical protein n=1 Tax=Sphingomonas sp. KRR8 TaxID=2942996 RepID=UPI0020225FA0|nr:hypothetical protein [Sphingomonas sp. KRR8]URD61835.1 hypothetical protein M8312_04805 [Sphingomonas sp. KRR8]